LHGLRQSRCLEFDALKANVLADDDLSGKERPEVLRTTVESLRRDSGQRATSLRTLLITRSNHPLSTVRSSASWLILHSSGDNLIYKLGQHFRFSRVFCFY
jgi:hypothetical protein